jgi:protocatechuate 3,4-dioxygenase beta subunit
MRTLVLTLALAGLSARVASAQHLPARVAGTVSDTAGRPLAAAQVWVVGTRAMVRTDSLGRYEFDSLAAGPARLRTQIIGYVSQEQSTMLTAGERATLDFRVAPLQLGDPGNVVRSAPLEKADSQ